MADFKPLEFIDPPRAVGAAVKGSVRASGNGTGLALSMSAPILAKLEWPEGTVLAPAIDGNELRLQPLVGAAIAVRFLSKGGARFRLPRFVRLVWKDQAKRSLPHRIEGRSLIVTLPAEWLVPGPQR